MAHIPKDPVADTIDQIAIGGYGTVGTDLFRGVVRPRDTVTGMPVNAVFCRATSSGAPSGTFSDQDILRSATVQVWVRYATYDAGDLRTQKIYDYLAENTPEGYLNLAMNTSNPFFIGQDRSGFYEWSINAELLYDAVADTGGTLDFSDVDDSGWLSILF